MKSLSQFWLHYRRNLAALVGFFILLVVALIAASADLIAPEGPFEMVAAPFVPPGTDPDHILGSDSLGRDVLSGLVHGARVSLLIGIVAAFVSIFIGTAIGAIAGYYGGWVDDALTRVTELFQTIPPFLLLIVLVGIFQPTVTTVVIAIAVVSWPWVTRLVRAEFLSLRDREFVQAGIVIGMSDMRIMLTQILPNAAAPIIIASSLIVARAILNESALSFLGLGDPNVVSWGSMIGSGRTVLQIAPYLTVIPGTAILCTVLAFNLVGDGMNDALNPRRRIR